MRKVGSGARLTPSIKKELDRRERSGCAAHMMGFDRCGKEGEGRKSGFEDAPSSKRCRHPEHNPPNHLYIPPGKQYRHICPGCGKEMVIQSSSAE